MGGLAGAKKQLEEHATREALMAFMRQFRGVGPKYARNIFMDVYHPEFRQSIAIDARIESILKALGLSLKPYPDAEQFCLKTAEMVGLNGWELDRLLYKFTDDVRAELAISISNSTRLSGKEAEMLPKGLTRDIDGVLTLTWDAFENNQDNHAFPVPTDLPKRKRTNG